MKKLPLIIILLVIFLTLFFTLERIAPPGVEWVDMDPFIYVLATLAIVFTILLRTFTHMKPAFVTMMWGLFYLFLKLVVFNGTPFWGQSYSLVTLIEIAFLLGGVWLAQAVGSQLQEFHDAVEKIIFANSSYSHKFNDEIENINSEIYRSRRYKHPLTMILFQPSRDSQQLMINKSVQEVYKSLTSRFVAVSLAKVLRENIRQSDRLIELSNKDLYLVLAPETTKDQSDQVLEAIREAARTLGTEVKVGISSFPEDALNLEDLLKKAEDDLSKNPHQKVDPTQSDNDTVLKEE